MVAAICSFCTKPGVKDVTIRTLQDQHENKLTYHQMLDMFKDLQIHPSKSICNTCITNLINSYNFYNLCLKISNEIVIETVVSVEPEPEIPPEPAIDKRLYKCPHCGQMFRNFKILKTHETIHRIPEQCDYCRKIFPSEYDVECHVDAEHTDKKYTCIFCAEVKYNKLFYLLGHLSTVHKSASPANFCFECGDKSEVFGNSEDVMNHIKEEHASKLHDDLSLDMHEEFLDECFLNEFLNNDMTFNIDFDLPKLVSEDSQKANKVYRYLCPKCNDGFNNQKQLYIHAAEIHDELSLICKKCNKKFRRLDELKLHKATHDHQPLDPNDLDCKICNKKFTSRKGAEYHMEVKHLNITYECLYCSKIFPSSINLNRHINQQHSNVKMHLCSLCDRHFPTLDHLKKHVESGHQKVKNFLCTRCGKTFSQLCHLKGHSLGCNS